MHASLCSRSRPVPSGVRWSPRRTCAKPSTPCGWIFSGCWTCIARGFLAGDCLSLLLLCPVRLGWCTSPRGAPAHRPSHLRVGPVRLYGELPESFKAYLGEVTHFTPDVLSSSSARAGGKRPGTWLMAKKPRGRQV
eukprot:2257039-Prymnesium_polylepis.3